jgi:RHS repeat-associated protein
MTRRARLTLITIALAAVATATLWDHPEWVFRWSAVVRASQPVGAQAQGSPAGQSTTLLPDGRLLLLGGSGAESSAWIVDPHSGNRTPTAGRPQMPRAWHSATVLADGTVLIIGGREGNRLIDVPEIFDPESGIFTPTSMVGALSRAAHTATLLTDGRVLIAGGTNGSAAPVATEIWDVAARSAMALPSGGVERVGHTATLLDDGRVLIAGGNGVNGAPANGTLALDPTTGSARRFVETTDNAPPFVAASIPGLGATDVPVEAHVALRFSKSLSIASLTSQTVLLDGPDGHVATRVIVAEKGRLAFIWPTDALANGATYTVRVAGEVDQSGTPVAPASMSFTTVQPSIDKAADDGEEWIPDALGHDRWRANRPPSSWESMPPLSAPPGVTAIAGRVLTLDGRPLSDVTLAMDGAGETRSDRTGRFLLLARSIGPGRHALNIIGKSASHGAKQYGFFEYGMTVAAGQTNVLPFTIWMPKLDIHHTVKIPSPTTSEIVVTTPYIPGLELHMPPNTVIRGDDGKVVTELGITAIPIDRPPFPLAKNVDVPIYFTIQPGGAYVYTNATSPKGAWLVYPNYGHKGVPGQRVQFFHYDPDVKDWYVYGPGRVTPNGAQVVPDSTTRLYQFTGAMVNDGTDNPGDTGENPGTDDEGDPMDPSTGVFLMHKTDLYLPDVLPLALTRTYNSGDNLARAFGRGMVNPYGMFLWSAHQYTEADLILPEGGKIHYVRTSGGTGYSDAVFEHTATPTRFYKSTIAWNGNGWNLTLKNGAVYVFGENAPLQAIKDRYGNTITVTHATGQTGNVTRVSSPNGRFIAFTYDTSNRITQSADNIGRTVAYTYDTNGNLSTVTDPESNVTTYTYDASNRLATITDGRSITYLTNQYDTSGRVSHQTLGDSSATYGFSYTVDGSGSITQTDVTDPRGHVKRLAFNSDHYITSVTQAYGTSLARTTTTTRATGSNLVTSTTDSLGRRTDYTYDGSGHVLTTTRLAGTAGAVTTTYTYEPTFSQLATVTDPLSHTWTIGYDAAAKPMTITDPLSHVTTVASNSAGQPTSVTDPLSHSWQIAYSAGDFASRTDPLGAVSSQFTDAAGRVVSQTDPLGRVMAITLDKLNRATAVIDPAGSETSFSYDANNNLLSLTDALTHVTAYTYDTSDRVATQTDPLSHAASYAYDLNGNVTQVTDRKSQVTNRTYDELDRLTEVTFDDSSTIDYTYDAGDRVTEIDDSANGTITRTYDDMDRFADETTPQGTVDYTYDADGRRATMTVAGQTEVDYAYDDAHRLTSITQGTTVVALTYDDANRRSTLTLPNGIIATYGYDAANHLTSLAYALGATTLGDLSYTYDIAGNRTSVGGTWARTGIPSALTTATYDAANRITSWAGTSFTYDLNGNLTNDGTMTYTWNARDQLIGVTGGASATFAYDGTRRRRTKTIGGTTSHFLYDNLNVIQEQSSSGTATANLLTSLGIDETFTRAESSGTVTFLVDALGSTIALTDGSGTVVTQYTFDPFGATTTSGTTSTNTAQFTGRENDLPGLYFYRARFYQPMLQRFAASDVMNVSAGVNLYTYGSNQPTMLTDPLGLSPDIPSWFWNWWNIFFPPAIGTTVGAAAGDAAEAVQTLEEGRKILEKEQEIEKGRTERDNDVKRAICDTAPDWPFCKDLPPKKKKTKSDDKS